MSLWYPPALGGALQSNPLTTKVDRHLNFPYGCCDSKGQPALKTPGPCRGHLDLVDKIEGQPQITWHSGKQAYFQLSTYAYSKETPGSTHYGGSCQVGFSIDKGISWKVAASYPGNCPHRNADGSPNSQEFWFTVPTGMPEGPAIFAWIWLNREHEFFMNCASVNISNTSEPDHLSTKPCDWRDAPELEVSYYTIDAVCAANAKFEKPQSDKFEIGWNGTCGIVAGDGAYPIKEIEC